MTRVADVQAALSQVQAHCPDVILLDVALDRLKRCEILRAVRNVPLASQVPVIMVLTSPGGVPLALGRVEVLQKPVTSHELFEAVDAIEFPTDRQPKVLIVDDQPSAVELAAARLETRGLGIQRAYGGAAALAAIRSEPPDLLLLDLMMPEVTGFDVLRELQEDPRLAKIAVIVLTTKTLTPEETVELERGVVRVLAKQPEDLSLLESLEKILRRS